MQHCHNVHFVDWREKMRETNYYPIRRSNASTGLIAFLIGGLIGGTLALLYAPQSGKKTRKFLADSSQDLLDTGQETVDQVLQSIRDAQESVQATIEDAQARMESLNQDTREKLQRLQEIAQETVHEEKQVFKKKLKEAKNTAMGD
jgi:gas vesicle protein